MPSPGANRSTQGPSNEDVATRSKIVPAPTVNAPATWDGEKLHASPVTFGLVLSEVLPAATTYVTLAGAAIELVIACSRVLESDTWRLMFATAGVIRFRVTHSTPASASPV